MSQKEQATAVKPKTTTTTSTTTTTTPSKFTFDTRGFQPIKITPQPQPQPQPPQEVAAVAPRHVFPSPTPEPPQQQPSTDSSELSELDTPSGSFWHSFRTTLYTNVEQATQKISQAIDEFNSEQTPTDTSSLESQSNDNNTPKKSKSTQQTIVTADINSQLQSTVVSTVPIDPLRLQSILRCIWCDKIVSNPVTIGCGHTVCHHCMEEMYIIFNPEQQFEQIPQPLPLDPTVSSSSTTTQPLTSQLRSKSRNLKVIKYDGIIECPTCNVTSHITSPPSLNIMLCLTLALFHQHYEVISTAPAPGTTQHLPVGADYRISDSMNVVIPPQGSTTLSHTSSSHSAHSSNSYKPTTTKHTHIGETLPNNNDIDASLPTTTTTTTTATTTITTPPATNLPFNDTTHTTPPIELATGYVDPNHLPIDLGQSNHDEAYSYSAHTTQTNNNKNSLDNKDPDQEIVLDLNFFDDSPQTTTTTLAQRANNNNNNANSTAPATNLQSSRMISENYNENNDNKTTPAAAATTGTTGTAGGNEDDPSLVSRLRKATLFGLMSLENVFNKDDEDNDDKDNHHNNNNNLISPKSSNGEIDIKLDDLLNNDDDDALTFLYDNNY